MVFAPSKAILSTIEQLKLLKCPYISDDLSLVSTFGRLTPKVLTDLHSLHISVGENPSGTSLKRSTLEIPQTLAPKSFIIFLISFSIHSPRPLP